MVFWTFFVAGLAALDDLKLDIALVVF